MTGQLPSGNGRDERSHSARSAHAVPAGRPGYPRAGVVAPAAISVTCVLSAAAVLLGGSSAAAVRVVLGVALFGLVATALIAHYAARAANRYIDVRVWAVRLIAQRGQAELRQLADRLMRGEQIAPPVSVPPTVPAPAQADGDQFGALATELEQANYRAGQSVLRVAGRGSGGRADQRVEIFVNLARRMQSLVHREIELLDELESKVEDPELLKALFDVDHLATRLRRQSESLAVLGGETSRRQWTRQVTMHEVLRAGTGEVEQYSRVKVVPPVEGMLSGAAVTDVIHLIAELVENATRFSPPHTTVLLRAQRVSAGIAIEVEDRGSGIRPGDKERLNDLLAAPDRVDVGQLLSDGRIGLYVVATLARRHGIRVWLENNIYGGTQATVVLPGSLLDEQGGGREQPRGGEQPRPRPAAGRATGMITGPIAAQAGTTAAGSAGQP